MDCGKQKGRKWRQGQKGEAMTFGKELTGRIFKELTPCERWGGKWIVTDQIT